MIIPNAIHVCENARGAATMEISKRDSEIVEVYMY